MGVFGADVAGWCAMGATALAVAGAIPQLHRVVGRGEHAGLSVTSAAVGVTTEAAWLTYALGGRLWALVPEAALMGIADLVLLVALVRRGAEQTAAAGLALAWAVVLAAIVATSGTQGLALALATAYAVQVAPAVWTAWVTPVPSGVSVATWALIAVEGSLWGAYGVTHGDRANTAFAFVALLAATAVLTRKARVRALRRTRLGELSSA